MLRYSRFPWLSIVDYCSQDCCNVLYYREIDPAAGTSGLLAGIGRVWPRESVWSEKGGSFHFEDGGERGEWPPGWIGCPQALANARQGRGFALIECGARTCASVAGCSGEAGWFAGRRATMPNSGTVYRGAAGRRLDDGGLQLEGRELSCLSVCPWALAKLKMESGNCLTLFLCLRLCLSHWHTYTHNLGPSSVKVEQMLSLRVSQ